MSNILNDLPQQFRSKPNIEALVNAFEKELRELEQVFADLRTKRSVSTAAGKQLDMTGSIVNLTRAEAMTLCGTEATDEIYRTLLKYKILLNTNRCTVPEMYEACKLLYDAQVISYHESRDSPAAFQIAVGAEISPQTVAMLNARGLKIKPAGVRCNLSFYSMDFFGFKDLNEYALGFGKGKFAQEVTKGV